MGGGVLGCGAATVGFGFGFPAIGGGAAGPGIGGGAAAPCGGVGGAAGCANCPDDIKRGGCLNSGGFASTFSADSGAGPSSGDRCGGGWDGIDGGAACTGGGAIGGCAVTGGGTAGGCATGGALAGGEGTGGGAAGPGNLTVGALEIGRGCAGGTSAIGGGPTGGAAAPGNGGGPTGGAAGFIPAACSLIFCPRCTRCCLMSPTTSCTSKSSGLVLAISSNRKNTGFSASSSVICSTC